MPGVYGKRGSPRGARASVSICGIDTCSFHMNQNLLRAGMEIRHVLQHHNLRATERPNPNRFHSYPTDLPKSVRLKGSDINESTAQLVGTHT